MRNIILVGAISTGKNFIPDIIKRNYKPVVIEDILPDTAEASIFTRRKALRKKYEGVCEFVTEKPTYEETLETVKAYDPLFVIPGSEDGVPLAIRLASDLDVTSNPYENLTNYIHKDSMQEALKKHNLRYIKGKIVSSVEEGIEYYRNEKLKGCVVKPARGAGSVGVHICDGEEDMIEALKVEFEGGNTIYGEKPVVVLQERIVGTEYIVNTVSYNGKHRLSSVWRYKKVMFDNRNVYDYCESISELEPGHTRLVDYALKVADAVGYKYGAIHGEYMIDENGPVLIEVNCRVMGAGMTAEFLDPVLGHHETDNVLDSYLNPEWHEKMMTEPYRPFAKAYVKFFITPEATTVYETPVINIIRRLKSFSSAGINNAISPEMAKTIDLETAGGYVFLHNSDERVLSHDIEFLRKAEKEYYNMLFVKNPVDLSKRPENPDTVEQVIEKNGCHRSICVLTNDSTLDLPATIIHTEGNKDTLGQFDYGILDIGYSENEDIEKMTEDFYTLADKLKPGGKIIVPERTYWHFPCDKESIEILCTSLDMIIEAPNAYTGNVIIATKR